MNNSAFRRGAAGPNTSVPVDRVARVGHIDEWH